jgi:glycosyltransferase involved in cell wall biosynthesis
MKTITLPVYKRADYLKRTLDALKANRTEGYTLYVSVDPGSEEVAELVRSIDFIPTKVIWNQERLGLNGNIRSVLFAAMEAGSEFNVAIEDDVTLTPDALDLAEWFRTLETHDQYTTLVFCNFEGKGDPRKIHPTRKFWSWGYCFARSGWEKAFVKGWDYVAEKCQAGVSDSTWDTHMMRWIMIGMYATLLPDLSRSTHIGEMGGTHFRQHQGEQHFDRFFKSLKLSDGSVRDGFHVEGKIEDQSPEEFERRILGRWK